MKKPKSLKTWKNYFTDQTYCAIFQALCLWQTAQWFTRSQNKWTVTTSTNIPSRAALERICQIKHVELLTAAFINQQSDEAKSWANGKLVSDYLLHFIGCIFNSNYSKCEQSVKICSVADCTASSWQTMKCFSPVNKPFTYSFPFLFVSEGSTEIWGNKLQKLLSNLIRFKPKHRLCWRISLWTNWDKFYKYECT